MLHPGWKYNLNDIKHIVGTDNFLNLADSKKDCQLEPYDNCTTRSYVERVTKKCGCLPLSKFLHWACELVISNHFVNGIYHSWLIIYVHPPGILIDYGMQSHRTYKWVKLSYRIFELFSWNGDVFLQEKDGIDWRTDQVLSQWYSN